MQLTDRFLWALIVLVALALVPFVFYFDPKVVITIGSVLFLFIIYGLHKGRVDRYLLVAIVFALFTNMVNDYAYDTVNYFVLGVNLFSFFSWTAGLVLLKEVYDRFSFRFKWFVFSLVYLAALLFVEYIGFHVLGIRLAAENPSLFGLGVIHGPPVMHIFYVTAGPIYLLVTDAISRAAFGLSRT